MKVKRAASNGRIAVSKHFFLDEFIYSANVMLHPMHIQNVFRLAAALEQVYKTTGFKPVILKGITTVQHQELLASPYSPELANGERVDYFLDKPGVDPRHTVDRIVL